MSSPTDDYQNYEDYEDYSDYLPNNRDFKVSGSGRKPPTERRTFTMPELRQRFPELNVINEPSINEIARLIQEGKAKRIVVMTGAGISTAAGIPDFRSPGTGLYHNLQKYNLEEAEDIFDIEYFQENPHPFFVLAKELYPGNYKPTLTHYFIKLLAQKQLLLRNFTQNIDTLERVAEIDENYLVEAHGSFATARCIRCKVLYDPEDIKSKILSDSIPRCKSCDGLVKPDIVFFGEGLPDRFFDLSMSDLSRTDLLIVIGTSLQVAPFCTLINKVSRKIPRLLINMTRVGENIYGSRGFDFDGMNQKYRRDALYLGTCDAGCLKLAQLLGWEDELLQMHKSHHEYLDTNNRSSSKLSTAIPPIVSPSVSTASSILTSTSDVTISTHTSSITTISSMSTTQKSEVIVHSDDSTITTYTATSASTSTSVNQSGTTENLGTAVTETSVRSENQTLVIETVETLDSQGSEIGNDTKQSDETIDDITQKLGNLGV